MGLAIYCLIVFSRTTTTLTTTTLTTTAVTTVTATTISVITARSLPSECYNYSSISDSTRLATATTGTIACDQIMFSSTITWWRFVGVGGTQIVSSAPSSYRCGTDASGWYTGPMPASATTVNGTVCYVWLSSNCHWSNTILITNCGSFYVYGLVDPPNCNLRYCTV